MSSSSSSSSSTAHPLVRGDATGAQGGSMPVAALAAAQAMTPPEGMDLDTLYHGDPEVNLQDFIPLAERAEEAEERIMSGMRKQKRSRKSTAAAAGGSDVEMGGEGIPGIGSEGEMSSWLTDGDDDEDYEDEGDVDADSSGLSSYDSSDLDDLLMSNNASQFLKSKARHRRRRRKKLRERKAKGLKPKKHKRPTVASGPSKKVSPEVREMLGQANNAFLKRDYETAIDDLKEAIRLGPGVPDPFLTLGLIYEEMGDAKKALEVLLVAAHLTPGDTQLWKRLAERSRDGLGNYTQAAYCFHRCWRSMQEEGTDEAKSVLWDMADCFMKIKRYGRAARYLQMLFEMHPGDLVIGRMLSKALYLQADKPATARVLEVCLGVDADGGVSHPEIGSGTAEQQPTPPRDADLMNMLCEVYIDLREYGKCRSILGKFLLPSTVSPNDQQALVTALSVQPIDLVVKLGVAEAYHHAQIGAAGRRSSGTARTTEEALALSKQEPTVAASVLAKACCGVLLMAAAQEMEDSGGRSPTGLEDLHLQLADAMHDNGHTEEALELLVALAQPGKVIDPVHAKTLCGRIGNYYYALGDIENAGKYLERAVETKAINAAKLSQDDGGDATSTTVSQQQNDPTVLVQLSDIWRRLGRSADADRLLLESLSYEDLLMCRSLPRAHSTKERKTAYNALMAILDSDELDVSRDASLEVPPEVQDKRLKFASAWISLMRDCELDNQRAVRYRRSQYPQYFTTGGAGGSHPMSPTKKGSRKGGGSTPKQQHSETTPLINFGRDDPRVVTEAKAKDGMPALPRIKKEMQLLGIDDLFGDKALIDFIVRGSYVCHLVGREQEAVEIIETVLHARRKRWSSSSGGETGTSSTAAEGATQSADHAGGGGGGSDHISRLEKTSFNLAIKARMRKVVFKYLRQKAVNNAHDKDYSTLSRTLSYLSKLMFYDIAAGDEESGFSMHSDEVKGKTTMRRGTKPDQLEFIDQRAWLIRQAIKYPQVYEYTLILGHLSTLAQTHRYSVREYYRAMRLRPNDPYPALLLTASLITMSISRVTYDRQLTITKGLAVFQLYEKLRLEQQGVSEVLAKAEIAYNQGRLWHQLSVFHLADRLYRQALTIIQKATRRDEVEDEVEYVRLAAAYNLATLHVQTGNRTMAARVLVHNIVPALQG